nr:hypothetical protein [uncultured archaeon]
MQFDIDGSFSKEWSDVCYAEAFFDKRGIYECLTKFTKTSNGCFWFYKEEFENGIIPNKLDDELILKLTENLRYVCAVIQLSKEGNFIKEWESIEEASKTIKIDRSSISRVCSDEINHKTAGGFMWKYKNVEFTKNKTNKSPVKRKVNQISKNGEVIKTWNSLTEASISLGIATSSIVSVCSNYRNAKIAGGFIWKYFTDGDISVNLEKSSDPSTWKKINQFSIEGIFIKTWNSIVEIVNTLNIGSNQISDVCANRTCGKKVSKTAGGFIWKYYKSGEEIKNLDLETVEYAKNKAKQKSKKVIQLTKDGIILNIWNSISEASKNTKASRTAIPKVCSGKPKYKTAGGFIWKYAEN